MPFCGVNVLIQALHFAMLDSNPNPSPNPSPNSNPNSHPNSHPSPSPSPHPPNQALHFAMIDKADEFQLVNFVLQFKGRLG